MHRDTGTFEHISSKELVPGDIIELPKHQITLVCDAVLLTGQCILNESMLTGKMLLTLMSFRQTCFDKSALKKRVCFNQFSGESVPVMKTSIPSHRTLYDTKECTHYTLYSGTSIIQTRYAIFYISNGLNIFH